MSRLFKQTYRDRRGKTRESARWYGEWRYADQSLRLALYTDRTASAEALRKLVRISELRSAGEQPDAQLSKWVASLPDAWLDYLAGKGILDDHRSKRDRELDAIITEYITELDRNGRSEVHTRQTRRLLETFTAAAGVDALGRWTLERSERFLAALTDKGRAPNTVRSYQRAMSGFARWCVRRGFLASNPVTDLSTISGGTRIQRRSMEPEECRLLIEAARIGPEVDGTVKGRRWAMSGAERALCYRLSLVTGIRAGELRSLVAGDFNLDPENPSVTLDEHRTKNRKPHTFALPASLLDDLRDHLSRKSPDAPAFRLAPAKLLARIIRDDLQRARAEWINAAPNAIERDKRERSSWLSPEGFDWHSLRVSFISSLARSGTPLAAAMKLARHTDPRLTARTYSRFSASEDALSIERLAALHEPEDYRERQRATGTDGRSLRIVGDDGEVSGRPAGRLRGGAEASGEKNRESRGGVVIGGESGLGGAKPAIPAPSPAKAEAGFEPANDGFAIRSLGPLGYSAIGIVLFDPASVPPACAPVHPSGDFTAGEGPSSVPGVPGELPGLPGVGVKT